MGRRRSHRRRRVRDRSAGAALHRAAGHDRAGRASAEGVTVWGSLQCPYYVHKALMHLSVCPRRKHPRGADGNRRRIRRQGRISVDDRGHAALLAWKSGKPVKMIYDRAEDMVATTKRHPSRTRHRTAVTRDGKIAGHGYRFHDRRRRVRNAFAGGAFARDDSCRGALQLPERAHPQPGGGDECSAARSFPRIRRAAERFRAGAASGSRGRGGGPRAG